MLTTVPPISPPFSCIDVDSFIWSSRLLVVCLICTFCASSISFFVNFGLYFIAKYSRYW